MSLRTETIDGVEVIHVDHPQLSDTFTIHSLGQELLEHIAQQQNKCVVLNLSAVEFIASTMVGKLISLHKSCRQRGIDFRICCVNPAIQEVLRMVRFELIMPVDGSQAEAIEAFQHASGDQPAQTSETAIKDLVAVANGGDAEAQYKLGVCYEEGDGVLPNSQLAIEWFKKAEAQGHVLASYKLATAYAFGVNTDQDFEKAMPHYEQAASAEHADSQYMMGLALHHGLAGVTNYEDAKAWYLKAAAQDHAEAKAKLKELEALTEG